jgi:serine protease AprX
MKTLCKGLLGAFVFTVGAAASAAPAAGTLAKLSPIVRAEIDAKQATHDVIVHMTTQADLTGAKALKSKAAKGRFVVDTLRATAKSHQAGVLALLNAEKSASARYTPYYVANVVAVSGATTDLLLALAERPDVAMILPDNPVRVIPEATMEQLKNEPAPTAIGANISSTGADRVWSEFQVDGSGIVVGNQDTGIDWDHPALMRKYRGYSAAGVDHNYNWHDAIRTGTNSACGIASQVPCDDHGHGTHTLGTSVGDDGAGNQVGMAPGAQWIACRNMNDGVGRPSTYIECFQFFLAPWAYGADPMTGDPSKAPHVMNNSWGCPTNEGCNGNDFLPVLTALKEAGVMVVAAAGNAGSSCSTINDAPAHHSADSFSVGAISHSTGAIASFSSRGPSRFDGGIGPDVSAPGVSVRSSIPGGGFSGSSWSGTSMASPHVVGAVALLWSADQSLIGDFDATAAALTSSADPKTSTQTCGGVPGTAIPNNTFGYGNLNVYRAVSARR